MKKFLITTAALLGLVAYGQAAEELDFAFELVRHGARAPIVNQELDKFGVGKGQLTPSGMRQRYLLGRYQRHRYTEQFKFLDVEKMAEQVYI